MKKIRKILTLTLSFMIALSLAACASNKDTIKKETKITLTDQAGRKVSLDKPAIKIVSSYYITTYACLSLELGIKSLVLNKRLIQDQFMKWLNLNYYNYHKLVL